MTALMEAAIDATLYFGRFDLAEAGDRLADLVARAAGGDSDALNTLMVRLEPKLRTVIKARSRGSLGADEIDDVVQDIWVDVWEKKVLGKLATPQGVVPMLAAIARNKTINASKAKAKAGRTHTSDSDVEPSSDSSLRYSHGRITNLGPDAKKVVRRAVTRALAKAKLTPQERVFVSMMFGMTTGGELQVPTKSGHQAAARKAGKTGTDAAVSIWGSRARKKFLQHFCTDKELCALLPAGRERSALTTLPGLLPKSGDYACKGVKDSCMESSVVAFASRVAVLAEGHEQIDEGKAGELVLSWLTEALART
jgi:DNA-directed RNA polymerase specialized sigma24 family protein